MPSKVLDHKSPYFRLFPQHPDIQHLRIFGTAMYPCLRSINQSKLQARTTLCVFLGHLMGYNGILCFNMSTAKLLVSRDVVQDESMFPFKQGVPVLGLSSSSVASTSSAPIFVVLPILSRADVPPPLSALPVTPPVPIASVSSSSGPSTSQFSSPSAVHDQEPSPTILPVLTNQQLDVLFPSLSSSSVSDISPINHHSMQTRSKSGVTKRKDFTDDECYHTSLLALPELDEPSSYIVARYSLEWGTWTLVPPPPPGVNIVGSKWIYKVKRNSYGSVSGYKVWLVAQGFSQTQGFNYSETFNPVVRHTTVRLILSLAAMHRWQLRQLDVKNAFLHGDLEEEVYMKQSPCFEDSTHPQYVCKLRKSLCGLKQAPREWNAKFTGYLPAIGFKASQSDPSLFVKKESSEIISYLSTGSIFVSQQKYAKELLAKHCWRSSVSDFYKARLSIFCNTVCQYMTNPSETHFLLVKRILRYIQGTMEYGVTFSPGDMHLHAYSNADWAGDPSTRRSTTGFVVFIGSNLVSWQSKKQGSVSRSSTEAEYRALANTAADIAWVRQVLADLHEYLPEPPLLFCDNLSALALSSNPVQHSRIKHLDIDFHFIRERVQSRDIMVQYIPTEEKIADVFTKGLHGPVIPSEFGSLLDLEYIDLSTNKLNESIPSIVGDLFRLHYLNLSNKKLVQAIPLELQKLVQLTDLDLSHNSLEGFIPKNFQDMRGLLYVDISYNQLEGPLPNNSALREAPPEALKGNKGLWGKVGALLPPCNEHGSKKHRKRVFGITFSLLAVFVLLFDFFTIVFIVQRRKKHKDKDENHKHEEISF
ncbi:PREDICTED: Retrovirus-related Pol poly from transposon [Prunus dulcis]|uniref:PREDICTED: Retrovirus-related Pol poly from transposon n=1 Tax=Prunus dulcis TaxID=3755 RepID=A0A5E4GHZ5_PRUDU|nr:PREDICTED: Retrovirus-related Pol poly from transposon [Prunus dulcis]